LYKPKNFLPHKKLLYNYFLIDIYVQEINTRVTTANTRYRTKEAAPGMENLNKIITFIGPRRAGKTYFMIFTLRELIEKGIISKSRLSS
jgi:predicted AAA+ superfamily ATPase